MTTSPPMIQVLSRYDYKEQYIVSLPDAFPLPALAPSAIRVKTSILSLTVNNITYGRLGHLIGIWDVHTLSVPLPTEYADPERLGRLPAWGYATVLESNVSGVEAGDSVFGLHSIGTLPIDMQLQGDTKIPSQFYEVSKQREKVLPIYNEYKLYPAVPQETREQRQDLGIDVILQKYFETSFLINRFVFPWDAAELTQLDDWTLETGSIDNNTVMLVFADSGKTALTLAYLLGNCRPIEKKPHMVVGIGSSESRAFVQGTAFYDKTLTYDYDSDSDNMGLELGMTSDSTVVICEFGSRGGAADRWAIKLRESGMNVKHLIIGSEVRPESPERTTQTYMAQTQQSAAMFNSSSARAQAIALLGGKKYLEQFDKEWTIFKERGMVKGLQIVWGKGMEDVSKGWETLCKGEVRPNEGLVFSLD